MPVYAYTAMNAGLTIERGTLSAESPVEGRQKLRDQQLKILAFDPAQMGCFGSVSIHRIVTPRRRREQVAEVARYLSLLLRAGVPLVEALDVLTRQHRGALTVVVKDVRDRVRGGSPAADALALHGRWFDTLFISAVRVGELTGNLDDALSELADHLETGQRLRSQLTTALMYPAILCCVGVAVVIFLMSSVIPQLLTVLEASGRTLPTSTLIIKNVSDALVDHKIAWLLSGAALALAVACVHRSRAGRRMLHGLQLHAPLLGPLIQKSVVAQFAQRMSLLLHTGVPFVDAVRTVEKITHNQIMVEELRAMATAVESGAGIASTIKESRVFPPVVAHLVAVGQDTGELPAMLEQLKSGYEAEIRMAVTRFTTALEPLLIVLLAIVVGFVVFACLMPILEATRGIAG